MRSSTRSSSESRVIGAESSSLYELRGFGTFSVEREVYVALGVAEAAQLARAGFLEDENAEDMMELAAW